MYLWDLNCEALRGENRVREIEKQERDSIRTNNKEKIRRDECEKRKKVERRIWVRSGTVGREALVH